MRTSTYAKTVQATLSRVGIHQNFNLSKTDYQITLLIKLQNFKKWKTNMNPWKFPAVRNC